MPSVSLGIGAAASLGSSLIGSSAASDAADTQAAAAQQAAQAQMQMFQQVRGDLSPYMQAGTGSLSTLQGLLPQLTATFNPTMQQLEQTPGYQFNLDQGLKSVQNSYAAQGLGTSGAAMKGAANYASGLASTTYQQQFQNYLAQNQQQYNMYQNLVNMGENAAAGVGQMGLNAQSQANALTTSGAAASAAGQIGSANALMGGISGIGNAASQYAMFNALGGSGMFGSNSGQVPAGTSALF